MQLMQLASDNAALESNSNCSRAECFYVTAKRSLTGNSLFMIPTCCFQGNGTHTGAGECCKPLRHLKDYVHMLGTF